MSGKADRLPRRALRRLTPEQRDAYDRLRWHEPGPADRARLKTELGWRRSRDETLALARELLADGLNEKAVAKVLEVGDRYLHRLLAAAAADRGLRPPEIGPANPLRERVEVALTRESDPDVGGPVRRAPAAGFADLSEIDAWLERGSV